MECSGTVACVAERVVLRVGGRRPSGARSAEVVMPTQTETLQVTGIRCERCVGRLAGALQGHDGLEYANANLMARSRSPGTTSARIATRSSTRCGARASAKRNRNAPPPVPGAMERGGSVACVAEREDDIDDDEGAEPLQIATAARDRVRFEEDALALADQVYRVARHLANSREEAEDLVQETYARAFRSWRSFQPGTNLRAWLLRILTNLNIDRGRRTQRAPQMTPLEANDYFLYDKLAESGDGTTDEDRVVERLSQDDVVAALSAVPHDFRDVIVLVDLGDFSYQDAAQILDIPIGTVMSRLHRGRRILKRELAESLPEGEE